MTSLVAVVARARLRTVMLYRTALSAARLTNEVSLMQTTWRVDRLDEMRMGNTGLRLGVKCCFDGKIVELIQIFTLKDTTRPYTVRISTETRGDLREIMQSVDVLRSSSGLITARSADEFIPCRSVVSLTVSASGPDSCRPVETIESLPNLVHT
jgi:hypothetical protein